MPINVSSVIFQDGTFLLIDNRSYNQGFPLDFTVLTETIPQIPPYEALCVH